MSDDQHDPNDDRIGMTKAQVEQLGRGYCPDCNGTIFRPGPHSGPWQNIECICGSRFNVLRRSPRPDGSVWISWAQRIPSEADGGGVWREDMFPRVLE